MSVDFRYANFDDYHGISRFLDEYWAKDHIYVRSRELFDWTFTRRSHWEENTYSFALAEDGGELVGILGGIPFTFNCLGEISRGVWIVNYAVRPDHRRGSTALQLLSMFRRPAFRVVIASGLNPATVTIYRVLRGLVLPETPRHFVILPDAVDRMVNLLLLANPEWDQERARTLVEAFRLPGVPQEGIEHGTSLPPNWDAADWPAIAARTVGTIRDAEYLQWRYLDHPCFEYRFITVPEKDRTGLAVWRLETIRRDSPSGRIDVDRIGRLVEFLPASPANARSLLSVFFQQIHSAGAFGADFYGYHGDARAMLRENGFPEIELSADGQSIPSRFQPLDGHTGGILNAMFVQDALPCCTTDADCAWYWTKSDSDQDRPN